MKKSEGDTKKSETNFFLSPKLNNIDQEQNPFTESMLKVISISEFPPAQLFVAMHAEGLEIFFTVFLFLG